MMQYKYFTYRLLLNVFVILLLPECICCLPATVERYLADVHAAVPTRMLLFKGLRCTT
jgi:hypothetical protein